MQRADYAHNICTCHSASSRTDSVCNIQIHTDATVSWMHTTASQCSYYDNISTYIVAFCVNENSCLCWLTRVRRMQRASYWTVENANTQKGKTNKHIDVFPWWFLLQLFFPYLESAWKIGLSGVARTRSRKRAGSTVHW